MGEIILRFILGGAIVSAFAAMGDMLKPKSFAGLFGAAPSVADCDARPDAAHKRSSLLRRRGPFHDRRRDRFFRICLPRVRRHGTMAREGAPRDPSGYARMGLSCNADLVSGVQIMKPYGIEIDLKGLRGMGWRD